MVISEQEALASFRVMVCVAMADGKLHDDERASLEAGLQYIKLPSTVTLRNLLDEECNLDIQLKQITTSDGKEACYTSAYAIAHTDGECTPEEKKLLDHIKTHCKFGDEKSSMLGRVFSETKDTFLPSNIKKVDDPAQRAKEIKEDTFKYAVMSGVLGAFPFPGLAIITDLAAVGLQVKLIRDIGQYYGHSIDKAAAKSLMLGVGVGTGARIAVSNLAKFIPGFGSAVGAGTSFAATYAIGKMATAYFENGAKLDMETLKKTFKSAEAEGKNEYGKQKETIAARSKEHQKTIEKLAADRKAGVISDIEFQQRLESLA